MEFKLEKPEHQRTAIQSVVETLLSPSFGTPLLLLWSPCDEKVVHALVVLVLADQHLYLVVIEPVAFLTIKEVEGLGEQLTVVHVVLEVDHARSLHADKAARAGGIGERLHLVGGTDEWSCHRAGKTSLFLEIFSTDTFFIVVLYSTLSLHKLYTIHAVFIAKVYYLVSSTILFVITRNTV